MTFTLVPSNDGPVDALAGWSVTEVLPEGLTLVSMTGADYTCAGATCTSTVPLAAGRDGAMITVTAKLTATGTGTLRNVAFVAPASGDTPETTPLGPTPAPGTDTDTTATDNDAHADVRFVAPPKPLAFTGANGIGLSLLTGLLLALVGGVLVALARRREEEQEVWAEHR